MNKYMNNYDLKLYWRSHTGLSLVAFIGFDKSFE